jgi:hypothetical protein
MRNPFRYFNSSPEVIRLTVMMYIRYPLSPRQVEDLLVERGIDICHETPGSQRCPPILEARDEKVRSTSVDCDRSTSFIAESLITECMGIMAPSPPYNSEIAGQEDGRSETFRCGSRNAGSCAAAGHRFSLGLHRPRQ